MGRTRTALSACAAMAVLAAVPAAASAAPRDSFVTDQGAEQMAQFTLGSGDTLTFRSTGPATGTTPYFEAVTPNGKYLYVANINGFDLSQYSVGSDGTLAPLSPATVSAGSGPIQVAISPDGKNAYAVNYGAPADPSGSVTEYSIGSDGTLTKIGSVAVAHYAESIAVSPDGSSVYVALSLSGRILEYNRGSDGTLTPKSQPSVPFTGGFVPGIGITPDGRYLYAAGDNDLIDEYSVGSGGQLTPLPVASVPSGSDYSLVVSPNGHNVYTSDCNANLVDQYSVGSDGELAPMTPATVAADGCGGPWMTAGGGSFYLPDAGNLVDQYNVSSTGALTPKSPASVTDSSASSLWAFVIPPDQGPVAAFTTKAGKAGKATTFNASSSSDSDGTVASYRWSFGDGASATTTTPTVSHTYKKTGHHTVTLTVADDSGCSTTEVFTGQTAYCNGTSAAQASQTVKIAASLKPLKLTVSPRSAKAGQNTCYAFRVTSKGHAVKKVKVTLAGHTARTSASGRATLCLTLNKGNHTARARRTGYSVASARIRVSGAPAFTG